MDPGCHAFSVRLQPKWAENAGTLEFFTLKNYSSYDFEKRIYCDTSLLASSHANVGLPHHQPQR